MHEPGLRSLSSQSILLAQPQDIQLPSIPNLLVQCLRYAEEGSQSVSLTLPPNRLGLPGILEVFSLEKGSGMLWASQSSWGMEDINQP